MNDTSTIYSTEEISATIRARVELVRKARGNRDTNEMQTLKRLTVSFCELFASKDNSFNKSKFYSDSGF